MDKRFAILLEALGHLVLVEFGKDTSTLEVSLRHRGEHYRGEIFGSKAYQYLLSALSDNSLAKRLLSNHVSRWVSDTLERLPDAPAASSREVPACIMYLDGRQVVVEPSYHIDSDTGRTRPCLAVRTTLKNGKKHTLVHTFEEHDEGYKTRDSLFCVLADRQGIPAAVHALLEQIKQHFNDVADAWHIRCETVVEAPAFSGSARQAPACNAQHAHCRVHSSEECWRP